MSDSDKQTFDGRIVDLYDVFVDWPGRLGRELPGLRKLLESAQAQRVLDLGCGTGRHVAALIDSGFDAYGADPSAPMLEKARKLVSPERLFDWDLASTPPDVLLEEAPFDALISLGNVWPQLLTSADIAAATENMRRILRPDGLLLLGLKALGERQGKQNTMPVLRRQHEGRPLWFIRFLDLDIPQLEDGSRVADFHILIVGEGEELHSHRCSKMRVWTAAELVECFRAAQFHDVRISGRLDDREAAVSGEDVFLSCRSGS